MKTNTKLTKQAAKELEQELSIDPSDELSRLKLIGYYPKRAIWHREDGEKAAGHELWFVRNQPSHPELRNTVIAVYSTTAPRCEARTQWNFFAR